MWRLNVSSSGVVSSSNSSSSRNIWVSGLSSNTKAADLKNLFGKYGKVNNCCLPWICHLMFCVKEKHWNEICFRQVLSAKVVTNARSPGSKCYGLVTMSSSTEVTRCVSHLDCTELHGQQIYVERVSQEAESPDLNLILMILPLFMEEQFICFYLTAAVFQAKNDPFKKEPSKKEAEDKAGSSKSGDKRSSTGTKWTNKWVTGRIEELILCWIEIRFNLLFSSHSELSHRTKKMTRSQINSQRRTKIYPRNRKPRAQSLSLCHPTWDKIHQRKTTENTDVGFIPPSLTQRIQVITRLITLFLPLQGQRAQGRWWEWITPKETTTLAKWDLSEGEGILIK